MLLLLMSDASVEKSFSRHWIECVSVHACVGMSFTLCGCNMRLVFFWQVSPVDMLSMVPVDYTTLYNSTVC